MAFFIGIFGLFLLACLTCWWVRGGVIPAIMLTMALVPICAVGMVVAHDKPTPADQGMALFWFLGLTVLVWLPRMLRRNAVGN